jgi:hypothetical protein
MLIPQGLLLQKCQLIVLFYSLVANRRDESYVCGVNPVNEGLLAIKRHYLSFSPIIFCQDKGPEMTVYGKMFVSKLSLRLYL